MWDEIFSFVKSRHTWKRRGEGKCFWKRNAHFRSIWTRAYLFRCILFSLRKSHSGCIFRSLSEVWKHMQCKSVPLGKDVPTNSFVSPEQCKNTWRFIQWRMALDLQNFICYPSHNHCVATTQPFARQGKDRNQQSKRGNGTEAPAEPPRDV